jgi:hypothetical protein
MKEIHLQNDALTTPPFLLMSGSMAKVNITNISARKTATWMKEHLSYIKRTSGAVDSLK